MQNTKNINIPCQKGSLPITEIIVDATIETIPIMVPIKE